MDLTERVPFDLARDAATWSTLGICAGFVLVVPLSIWLLRRSAMGRERPWLAYVLSMPWLMPLLIYLATLPQHLSAKSAVREGRATVLEGVISDFDTTDGPRGRHYECIAVGEQWFHRIPGALHHKLPIGTVVRIHYIDRSAPEIVRLELLGSTQPR